MDIITLTSEVKETIDLDEMSSDELKKVVKHLWHKIVSLSSQVNKERWKYLAQTGGITCLKSNNVTF